MQQVGALLDFSQVVIRPLTANDSRAYRLLRKKILMMGDGKFFSDSYEREAGFTTEQQWRDWCTETREHCTFGTFISGELVGIMGIVAYGPPEKLTAEWEVIWLEPKFRRQGIAKICYEKIWQWTESHGYEKALVFIRTDNIRSMAIHLRQGAVYSHKVKNIVWADNSVADMYAFTINLIAKETASYDQVLQSMETLHTFLQTLDHPDKTNEVAHHP